MTDIDVTPSAITITVPDKIAPWASVGTALKPNDPPEQYAARADQLSLCKAFQRGIVAMLADAKQKAHEAHKSLTTLEARLLKPAQTDEATIKSELAAWDNAREAERIAEERRLREEARKIEEARRLEEAIELERQAKARAAQAVQIDDEIEQQIAQQEAAELQAQADAAVAAPVEAPVIFVPKATPKVEGVTYRETWSATVVDVMALIRHVATHPEHANLLTPNTTALNGLARSLRGSMAIPGVKAMATKQVASR